MKNIDTILQHAEQHCSTHGTRLTAKRKQLLAGLVQSNVALSAYELMDVFKANTGYAMPAMSVYRILDFLQGEKLVHKLSLANKYVACAHISCSHSHEVSQFLICTACSKVKEINLDPTTNQQLQQSVQQAGYALLSPHLEINCLCQDCQ
jgi:Fur family transcriptional regulator, zinc uptake regulator